MSDESYTDHREIEIHCKAHDKGFFKGYNKALEDVASHFKNRKRFHIKKVYRDRIIDFIGKLKKEESEE